MAQRRVTRYLRDDLVGLDPTHIAAEYEGILYDSLERARIIAKTDDVEVRAMLKRLPSDKAAAMATRRLSGFVLGENYKITVEPSIMDILLASAVHINKGFVELLLSTGHDELRWQAPAHVFSEETFGVGTRDNGQNLYGKALERLRAKLREDAGEPSVHAPVETLAVGDRERHIAAPTTGSYQSASGMRLVGFGKHSLRTLEYVRVNEASFVRWCQERATPSGRMQVLLDYCSGASTGQTAQSARSPTTAAVPTAMTSVAHDLLLRYVSKIEQQPTTAKYRRIRLGNVGFAPVWGETAVREVLTRGGWVVDDAKEFITLPASADIGELARLLERTATSSATPTAPPGIDEALGSAAVISRPTAMPTVPLWGDHVASSAAPTVPSGTDAALGSAAVISRPTAMPTVPLWGCHVASSAVPTVPPGTDEALGSAAVMSRPTATPTVPLWGGHAAHQPSVLSPSKQKRDRDHKIRLAERVQCEMDLQAHRQATRCATASGASINQGDRRGVGVARGKRQASTDARSAAGLTAATDKKMKVDKPCVYYAFGADNRCTKGDECPRLHGPRVSADNIAMWRRKAANAAAGFNKVRSGKAPVTPNAVRRGKIHSYDSIRKFGWIEPEMTPGASGRHAKHRLFFHVSDWAGTASTQPTGAGDVGRRVRYFRVEDVRDRTRWKATGVSALQ
jgi:predicted NAD-dependent protein-ADP-ribosyltransferase YbiA (DUF1768 family)